MLISGFDSSRPSRARDLSAPKQRVNQVVDQCVLGQNADLKSLSSDLIQMTQAARQRHPGMLAGQADPALAKNINRLHATANKMTSYVTMANAGHLVGPALAEGLKFLDSQRQTFNLAADQVFSSQVVVPMDDIPPARPDLLSWVDIPAGKFKAGYDNHEVDLPAYQIGKYPVTNAQYNEFVQSTGYRTQGSWDPPKGGRYHQGPEDKSEHPVVNVTFYDAQAFCQWVGGRLPCENEWEKAARGTDGRKYPWGNEWHPDIVNFDSDGTTPVTRFEKPNACGVANVSPYGAVDMVGNVLEWQNSSLPKRPGAVMLKGGAFTNYLPENLDIQPFDAIRHTTENPDSNYAGFGFRVARDLNPAQ